MKTFSGIKEIFDTFNNNENIEEKAIKIKKDSVLCVYCLFVLCAG